MVDFDETDDDTVVPAQPASDRIIIPKNEPFAGIAMLLAFFAIITGPLTGVPAIYFASQAKKRIIASGGRLVGLEKAKLAMGLAGTITAIFGLIFFFAVMR